MKISSAFQDASRVYFGHFGATVKFTVTELCMTLAALTPTLFLTESGLKYLALLAVPFWILLMFWARVNAAEAMKDALNGGSLFSLRLADPEGYGKKLLYGTKRMVMLLLWAAPLIAETTGLPRVSRRRRSAWVCRRCAASSDKKLPMRR